MFANRISHAFDLHGPSYTSDTACSSAALAIYNALLCLRSGQCATAIVGGATIMLRPATSLQFNLLNMLCPDGKCKFLDSKVNGYVRSEAVSVMVLQRKSAAKRIYATVIHAQTNTDGNKQEGITFPSWVSQAKLMRSTLVEAGVQPEQVKYLEAHGTGTPAGDPTEARAIAEVNL